MGTAIAVRTDYASRELRGLATRVKCVAQARRLLAIAAVLDGHSRAAAAKIGGMDRQTLRDWVIRFNAQGPDGLVNKPSPGGPRKLSDAHKAFLARIVEDGPMPAIHDVVRWRPLGAAQWRRCRRCARESIHFVCGEVVTYDLNIC
jgi:transposase